MELPPASYSNSSMAPPQNMIILEVTWCSAFSGKERSLLLPAFLCPPTTTGAPIVESELHRLSPRAGTQQWQAESWGDECRMHKAGAAKFCWPPQAVTHSLCFGFQGCGTPPWDDWSLPGFIQHRYIQFLIRGALRAQRAKSEMYLVDLPI